MKKKYRGKGQWTDNKDKDLKWSVDMLVESYSLPVKDPRLGWGSISPEGKWEPVTFLERTLSLNGVAVGIQWTLEA